jgi:hypothetical protein
MDRPCREAGGLFANYAQSIITEALLARRQETGMNNPVEKFRNLKEELKERQRFSEEQIQKVIAAVNPLRLLGNA